MFKCLNASDLSITLPEVTKLSAVILIVTKTSVFVERSICALQRFHAHHAVSEETKLSPFEAEPR
jgi:hypothetical protein